MKRLGLFALLVVLVGCCVIVWLLASLEIRLRTWVHDLRRTWR